MTTETCATYKLLAKNLLHGSISPGAEIAVSADQYYMHDSSATLVFLHLQNLPRLRLGDRLAVCYHDHNTLGDGGPENADDQRFLESACAHYGIRYSRPGNGIGHLLHLERFVEPGRIILGADSHVLLAGAAGMLPLACGGLELAAVMTGSPHYMVCPAVIRVVLTGGLRSWCSAKDLALELLGRLAGRRTVETALEFCGPGVKALSIPQRATIASTCVELGLTSVLFPADEVTSAWLAAQGRARVFHRLPVPDDAEVAEEITIDLSQVRPMVALPPSPLKVVPIEEVAGLELQQVAVGSCSNGSFEDLARVANLLQGSRICPAVDLLVAPGSRQVMQQLMREGLLQALLAAGARFAEPACGFCLGQGFSPASGSKSLRTSTRNFEGRCGTPDAEVYLASPESAAAAALTGRLTDPRSLKLPRSRPVKSVRLAVDDPAPELPAEKKREKIKIVRGPNITEPPAQKALAASLKGVVSLKLGDNVTTDHILPAGPHLRFRSNVQEYAWNTFRQLDPRFVHRAKEVQRRGFYNIIVAGLDYGSGSSREHAALCPAVLGVKVIIAKSFERLHLANLVMHGIAPLVFLDPRDYQRVRQDDDLELPWLAAELRRSSLVTARSHGRGYELRLKHPLSRRQIEILLAGGLCNYLSC